MKNSVWDNKPEEYDHLREGWLNQRRFLYICDYVEKLKPSTVLEIGSGTGALLHKLAQRFLHIQFSGLEPQSSYVEFAKSRMASNLQYFCGSAEMAAALLPDQRFDLILSNDVLHHVEDLQVLVESMRTVSQRGTHWLAIEPNPHNPYVFAGQSLKAGEKNFQPKQFRNMALSKGWKFLKQDRLFLIPPFIKNPPEWLKSVEKQIERIPFLSGGIVSELELI